MGYRKAARMRRTQYVRGHYRTSRTGKTYYVSGHMRNDYGDNSELGLVVGIIALFVLILLIAAA